MMRAAPCHIGIWIDRHEAILLAYEAELLDRSTLQSPGEGWLQERVDAQQYPSAQHYYDTVLSYLQSGDEILILGPGQAKRELGHRIAQHGGLKGKVVGLYQASRLAEVELVFPTSEVRCSEKPGKAQVDTPFLQPNPGLAEGMTGQP
jgi:hypothetical protein